MFDDGSRSILVSLGQFLPMERRIDEAGDWEDLHDQFHEINRLVRVVVRAVPCHDRADADALDDLLSHLVEDWLHDCSGRIQDVLENELCARPRPQFSAADARYNWAGSLREAAQRTDAVAASKEAARLLDCLEELSLALYDLETTVGQILRFLGKRLKTTIKGLNSDVRDVRASLTPGEAGRSPGPL